MNLKTKLVDSANAFISAKVDAKSVDDKVEKLAKDAAKKIKIDGFRAGKVPIAVVKKRYGNELRKDAEQEILRQIVEDSLKELNKNAKDMIGEPMIPKFDDQNGEINIEIEISFKPSVDVSGYEEIVPEHSTPRVTKKEIEAKKEELLSYIAPIEKVDKNELEKGDFAKFDFEGFVDGEAFEGGKANDYVLEIGSNQFIPGFEDGMIGLKVGESKDVNVTFPKEYGAENLAGKDAVFKVTLHEIQGKKIPETIDDEILKKLMPNEEAPSIEKLEDNIKNQIRNEKLQKLIQDELKPKFVDAALEKFKFDLPKNIVEQEIDMQFRSAWSSFNEDDMKKFRDDKDALSKKREEYRNDAIKSVSITFIVDELAKARNITISDQELIQTIYFEAYRYGVDPKQHLENYKNQGILPAVKMAMIEERLFNSLFDKDEKKTKEK